MTLRLICVAWAIVLLWPAKGQLLFSNAVKAGLTREGLRTGARPGGGDFSEVQPGNAGGGWSFRQWTFRLADDFTVPEGGWSVQRLTTFGYQTGTQGQTVNVGASEICRDSHAGRMNTPCA